MSRPTKPRKVEDLPVYTHFKPAGIPFARLEEIDLLIEELEAMRLKDLEELSQEECAQKMGISRQTFQLIIDVARKKVTRALIQGLAIRIEGGNYTLNLCQYECLACGEIYTGPYEQLLHQCPSCGSYQARCRMQEDFCRETCMKSKNK
ncbi:MAG: hypothetical protein AVO33_05210 [delta proteobacterium ML8_F1]|nr:MAG: hypothetical protein AVO33_05210 [delta proteobacterium ML8_F1]